MPPCRLVRLSFVLLECFLNLKDTSGRKLGTKWYLSIENDTEPTDRPTNGWTDNTSHRDAYLHLLQRKRKNRVQYLLEG